jgi:predicted RNase H-like HicB family nuclease
MITYKATYKFVEGGVSARALDFPGVITCGADLREAREMLAGALVDMAETHLMEGEALPRPDPMATDPESDIEEPIYLLLTAASQVQIIPLPAR